ncbi:unnamed protein product [Nippostrongylus brasiliensis]|uniref:Phlebovirus_G2 domain-containing protein n=1 Tax=Nippostrongylus brasiliensis TaxID=27835 RepID=A0A0N4YL96_NIPBR|nr:unnamed protein product [Nippostrongylus brasiliensis]
MQQEIALRPSIPHDIGGTTIKISSLVIPPTPALLTSFISDGTNVALWKSPHLPTLQCPSWKDAKDLQCELHPKCRCQPAEITVRCICEDHNLVETFHTSLVNRLPVRRPWISFEEDQNERDRVSVKAVIPTLSEAEILLSMKGEVNSTVKEITDSVCKVNNAEITGCYQCTQGAVAHIECQSQDDNTMATVICEDFTFSIPCSPRGMKSSLRFNFQRARIHLSCTVSCGQTETNFDVTGILHWTRTFYSAAEKILAGESNIYNEVDLPDIGHITSVFLAWYKFSLVVLGILVISVIAGYFFFFNCGLRIALLVVRVIGNVILRVVRTPILLLWRTIWKLRESSRKRHTSKNL